MKMKPHFLQIIRYVAVMLGFMAPTRSDAVLMHGGANDSDHIALGLANSDHVIWVRVEYQGAFIYVTGIRINDYYAITSAHALYVPSIGLLDVTMVGDGTNYFAAPGNQRTIAQVIVHPEYPNSSPFSKQDVAILRFTNPLPGTNAIFGPTTAVARDAVLTTVGFGQPGFSGVGFLPVDGLLRGWVAAVVSETSANFNSEFYGNTRFNSNPYFLNGRGSNYDSGSPLYDSQGRLVGMHIGSSPPATSYQILGSSIFLDLTHPALQSWIVTNTQLPVKPQIRCFVSPTAVNLTFADLIPSREYRVMRSPTLNAWEEAHRFAAAAATDSWGESLATGGKMFYRLEWNE